MNIIFITPLTNHHRRSRIACALLIALVTAVAALSPNSPLSPRSVEAGSAYANLSSANLTFRLTAASANLITANNNWTNVTSIEGYCGDGLANTHGVNPQTILTAEFATSALPTSGSTCVAANKGNPSAYNAGGLAEFDSGTYLAIGMQGNVQSQAPYMAFYVNTTGQTNVKFAFDATDIDGGSNSSVSQVALQYRIGETGNFTNIPAGYIADATDGGVAGRTTTRNVVLPAACNNQPQVQVRIITTDAAAADGTSSPDEWIGINNVVIGNIVPSAAGVNVGGRAITADGRGIARARIALWDDSGNVRAASTNGFGYYNFEDVEVGRTYVVSITSKRYVFSSATQFINVGDEISSLDFVAEN